MASFDLLVMYVVFTLLYELPTGWNTSQNFPYLKIILQADFDKFCKNREGKTSPGHRRADNLP